MKPAPLAVISEDRVEELRTLIEAPGLVSIAVAKHELAALIARGDTTRPASYSDRARAILAGLGKFQDDPEVRQAVSLIRAQQIVIDHMATGLTDIIAGLRTIDSVATRALEVPGGAR